MDGRDDKTVAKKGFVRKRATKKGRKSKIL